MIRILVFVSNMLGGFAVGLWAAEYMILKKARKENVLTSEATKKKLQFCGLAKYFLVAFVVMKIILVIM